MTHFARFLRGIGSEHPTHNQRLTHDTWKFTTSTNSIAVKGVTFNPKVPGSIPGADRKKELTVKKHCRVKLAIS